MIERRLRFSLIIAADGGQRSWSLRENGLDQGPMGVCVGRHIEDRDRQLRPAMVARLYGFARKFEDQRLIGERTSFEFRLVGFQQSREVLRRRSTRSEFLRRRSRQTKIAHGAGECPRESGKPRNGFEIFQCVRFASLKDNVGCDRLTTQIGQRREPKIGHPRLCRVTGKLK